jgi:uncharacterized membrane protein
MATRRATNNINQSNDIVTKKSSNLFNKIIPYFKVINNIAGFYLLWISIHFAAAHLYVKYCTPYTVFGFIVSPLINSAPHCIAFRWCISYGSTTITTMWVVVGTWLASKFTLMIASDIRTPNSSVDQ